MDDFSLDKLKKSLAWISVDSWILCYFGRFWSLEVSGYLSLANGSYQGYGELKHFVFWIMVNWSFLFLWVLPKIWIVFLLINEVWWQMAAMQLQAKPGGIPSKYCWEGAILVRQAKGRRYLDSIIMVSRLIFWKIKLQVIKNEFLISEWKWVLICRE